MTQFAGKSLVRAAKAVLTISAAAVLAACGGGSGAGAPSGNNPPPVVQPPAAPTTGTVALMLRDMPTDAFCRIYADIEQIDLLGGDGRSTIYVSEDPSGATRFDLLSLQTKSALVTIATEVPIGDYDKIRLTLADLSLVECDGDVPEDESGWEHPKIPGNGKLDLLPKGGLQVVGGETLLVEFDMDMNKSLHLHQTGQGNGKWQFRPVIFVTVTPDTDRLVRIFGQVRASDALSGFELCPADPMATPDDGDMSVDDDSGRCLDVFLRDGSGTMRVFNETGAPVGFGDNVVDGAMLTAIGFLGVHDDDDDDDTREDDLKLDAVVLHVGPAGGFESLLGTAVTELRGDNIFGFDTMPADDTIESLLDVLWQMGPILDTSDNSEVGPGVIVAGAGLEVNGVFTDPTTTPKTEPLNASLILFNEAGMAPLETLLDGTITEILDDDDDVAETRQMTVTTGADPDPVVENCVKTVAETRYLLIDSTGGSSVTSEIGFDGLAVDDSVDVYGAEEVVPEGEPPTGCIVADTIKKFIEPAPAP